MRAFWCLCRRKHPLPLSPPFLYILDYRKASEQPSSQWIRAEKDMFQDVFPSYSGVPSPEVGSWKTL